MVALALYVTQLYGPLAQLSNARVDLMTALVSFERVFEVTDLPHAIAEAPDARPLEAPRGHVRFEDVWFRYPRRDRLDPGVPGGAPLRPRRRGVRLDPARHRPRRPAGHHGGAGRALGGGQDHPVDAGPPDPRRHAGRGHHRRPGRAGGDARVAGRRRRRRDPGPPPLPRLDRRPTCATPAPTPPTRSWWRPAGRPASTTSSRAARRLRHGRRRTRLPPVRGREAARGHRPGDPQEPGGRDPRRGHRAPGLGVRTPRRRPP